MDEERFLADAGGAGIAKKARAVTGVAVGFGATGEFALALAFRQVRASAFNSTRAASGKASAKRQVTD